MTWVKPDFYREFLSIPESSTTSRDETGSGLGDLSFTTVCKHILRYGFVEVADDILFALLVGVILGGVLYLAIPDNLMAYEYARWLSYPVMVLVGIPLYICASASTPIAAALVAKGFSPGAALVFLMTGPATNTGTIAIVASQFGARFASVYVGSVIVVTVALGIAVDLLMLAFGLSLAVNLDASDSPALAAIQWAGALGLFALMFWRFRAGALKGGYQDLLMNLRPVSGPIKAWWARMTRNDPVGGILRPRAPAGAALWLSIVAVFLLSGFAVVRPGEVGYGRLFGAVAWRDLSPGLHYLAPWPLAQADKWRVREVKSVTSATAGEYLTGDVNLMSMSLNVQYRVTDPYVYHYRTANPEQVIGENIRKELRRFVAGRDAGQPAECRPGDASESHRGRVRKARPGRRQRAARRHRAREGEPALRESRRRRDERVPGGLEFPRRQGAHHRQRAASHRVADTPGARQRGVRSPAGQGRSGAANHHVRG